MVEIIKNFSMRNRPREDTLLSLKPMPDVSEIRLEHAKDIVLSNKKKGCYLRIVETKAMRTLQRRYWVGDREGGWNYFVTGDVPVSAHLLGIGSFQKAKEELMEIEGCVLFQEHFHSEDPKGIELDIHPLCYFNNLKQADEQIPKLWEWANKW